MTSVQEIAALLTRRPPGKRVVHVAGFAGDIAAYGDARALGAAGAVPCGTDADSGLQRGIGLVRDRVLHRMKALRAAGARVDAFTVEHPATVPPGPFGDMMLAEAVDSAVLEVFPRAEPPRRGEPGSEGAGEVDDGGEILPAGADAESASGTSADAPGPTTATPGTAIASASQQRPEVPHWETAMQERGIQWERIIDETRRGVHTTSPR